MKLSNRDNWVDCAKGIGIILVVYGHVARGLVKAGIEVPIVFYDLTDSIVYSFHMPLFFFLSGLFFYQSFSKRGCQKLIFSKIDTIFYPFLLWSIIQGSTEVLLSHYTNGNLPLYKVFTLLWAPRAQFWFLYALFVIFVFSAIIYSYSAKKYSICIFIAAAFTYIIYDFLPELRIIAFIAKNLVFFCFGIIFTQYFNIKYFSNKTTFIISFLSFIIGQWYFHKYLSLRYTDISIASLSIALLSIIFIVSISSLLAKNSSRIISYIGASSMSIFLMHVLAGSGTRVILNKVFHIESFTIHVLVGCIVGITAPVLVLIIIEKFKIPYILSAPVSQWICLLREKLLRN